MAWQLADVQSCAAHGGWLDVKQASTGINGTASASGSPVSAVLP
jgi:hypothetical protein